MMYPIVPVAKPRMTRSDKWKQRDCVLKYRAFKDECRLRGLELFEQVDLTFVVPMPASWSKKKREQMNGRPHQQRPDIDNYLKSLMDAVLEEDSHIWHVAARKIWGEQGAIIVKPLGVESYPLDLA